MRPEKPRPMIDEIRQQPDVLRSLVSNRASITADFVALMKRTDVRRIYFVGAGSPLYAAEVLRFAAIRLLGVDATAFPPSIFNAHVGFDLEHLSPEQMLLICPAESGKSKGQVDAARTARSAGIPVVCTTLNPKGVLARECDVVLEKPAGHEEAYVTTKGQSIAIALVLMCLVDAAYALGRLSPKEHARYLDAFESLPSNVEATISSSISWFYDHQEEVMSVDSYRFIGYGANFGTVNECMLKIAESVRKPSFCYELEETLHGPMISMGWRDMVFLLATEDGPEKERALELARVLQNVTPHVVVIQSEMDKRFDGRSLPVRTGDVEFIDAIEYMIPAQVIAFEVSNALGIDTTIDPYDDLHRAMETKYED